MEVWSVAILHSLSVLALQQLAGEGAVGLFEVITAHFSDQGQRLVGALRAANDRAWKAMEIALAGDSWWERAKARLASSEDRSFGQQIRVFLDGLPIKELHGHDAFRQQCLVDLRDARKKNLLTAGSLDSAELRRQAGALAGAAPQAILDNQWGALHSASEELKGAGYPSLAWLVGQRPQAGAPLLVLAVRHFFRREVENDAQLARGVIFTTVDNLTQSQQAGLDRLHGVLTRQSSLLEGLLGNVQAAVAAVQEVGKDTNERVKGLEQQVQLLLDRLQMRGRELKPRDSMSIRNEKERQLVKALLEQVRQTPEKELNASPDLLNGLGKVQVAIGEYQSAREAFVRAASSARDESARGEAFYNAYRAALEQRNWDDALQQLLQAIRVDWRRFAPFPVGRYTPQRIIGAGGFGVAFLCRHKHMQIPLVVKTLLDDLDRDADNVFTEVQLLTQLDDPVFVRAADCGYADPAQKARPYLVMDYFNGLPLDEYVRQNGPLSLAELKLIALPTANGLRSAHARGILHRDVKPANLLVRKEPDVWRVKLIDFGLALKRSVMDNTVASPGGWENTLAGSSIAGTLDYAAPEQMGKLPGVAIGPHSDVYGFGKTCYFALLGTPDPDDKQKGSLPLGWRKFLSDCTAQPGNRLPEFEAVLRRLARLKVPKPSGKKRRKSVKQPDATEKTAPETVTAATPPASPSGVFRILCPHCKRQLSVQEAHAGQALRCAACSGTFKVPAKPGAGPASEPLRVACPHCRQPLSLSRQHLGKKLKCPHCAGGFALPAGG
jgi:serine/threonine protein kinase